MKKFICLTIVAAVFALSVAADKIVFKESSQKSPKKSLPVDSKTAKDAKLSPRLLGSNLGFGIPIGTSPISHGVHTPSSHGVHTQTVVHAPSSFHPATSHHHVPTVSYGCRYWCRTPQGQAYCCENANQVQSLVFTKPGLCPPVRDFCPPTRSNIGPPAPCSNDGSCLGVDKCCYDVCLNQHTCKAPHGVGR